jgi:hypothetical protein
MHLCKRARNVPRPVTYRSKQRLKIWNYNFACGLIFIYYTPNSDGRIWTFANKVLMWIFESKEGNPRTNGDENTGVNKEIKREHYAITTFTICALCFRLLRWLTHDWRHERNIGLLGKEGIYFLFNNMKMWSELKLFVTGFNHGLLWIRE